MAIAHELRTATLGRMTESIAGAQRMSLCHRHQLQYLSAHVVREFPKCRGSTRDGASHDSR
jgi:hypothetical protein